LVRNITDRKLPTEKYEFHYSHADGKKTGRFTTCAEAGYGGRAKFMEDFPLSANMETNELLISIQLFCKGRGSGIANLRLDPGPRLHKAHGS